MRFRTTLALPAALALAVGAAAPAAAQDAPARLTSKKAIWGAVTANGVSQFPLYRDLGAGIFEQQLSWADVAPTRPANPQDPNDPAYRWPKDTDLAASEAAKYGMQLLLLVSRTPAWANGGNANTAVPPTRNADYTDFLVAAARRYPAVRRWMIYGEPIRLVNFLGHPQVATGKPNNTGTLSRAERADVHKYAAILDASYVALHRVNRRNLVIGGNTTTSGDMMGPLNWIRNLRLANGRPPRMDLFGHNPFSSRRPNLASNPIQPGTADFSDLDTLVGWIDKYLHRGARNKRLRLFLSEYTTPVEVPSFAFPYYVTDQVQASWLRSALNIARKPSNRIATLGWFRLQDTGPRPEGETRDGLINAQGVKRLAYYVFKQG